MSKECKHKNITITTWAHSPKNRMVQCDDCGEAFEMTLKAIERRYAEDWIEENVDLIRKHLLTDLNNERR